MRLMGCVVWTRWRPEARRAVFSPRAELAGAGRRRRQRWGRCHRRTDGRRRRRQLGLFHECVQRPPVEEHMSPDARDDRPLFGDRGRGRTLRCYCFSGLVWAHTVAERAFDRTGLTLKPRRSVGWCCGRRCERWENGPHGRGRRWCTHRLKMRSESRRTCYDLIGHNTRFFLRPLWSTDPNSHCPGMWLNKRSLVDYEKIQLWTHSSRSSPQIRELTGFEYANTRSCSFC